MRTARLTLAALAVFVPACGESPADAAPTYDVDVTVVDFAGLREALAERAGTPMLVNFWAMWCGPCVQELPDLAAVAADFAKAGGVTIGVSFDMAARGVTLEDTLAKLPSFLGKRGITFPILVEKHGDPTAINEHFDLPGSIPVTLAIDRTGRVVAKHEGSASRADFEDLAAQASR